MTEIQQIVDELRFLLQRDVIDNDESLANLLTEYSKHCHSANVRLRRCDDLLRQGLRSEALQLAEADPSLLDVVTILDFEGLDDLLEIVGMYFLEPPEPLLLGAAAALNTAYAEQQPLQKLLDLHRLLALGRSSIADRLTVLRSLADLDSSPHWTDDVCEMERARFREIDSESSAAAKSGNAAVLQALSEDLQTSEWTEPPPATLIRELKMRTSQTVRTNARQRIAEMNEELHTAFSALDLATARRLRFAWNQTRPLVPVDDANPLIESVAPILAWLDGEDRKESVDAAFADLIGEIEHALDDGETTVDELRRLQSVADHLQRRLPQMLLTRFQVRLKDLEFNETRRKKLLLAAGTGAFAAVVALFGFIAYRSIEGQRTHRLASVATAYIEEGKLDEAKKLIDQEASHATSETWLAVKKKFADAESAEHDRIANWKSHVATATQSSDLAQVEVAIKQARGLSKTAEERIEVGQLQSNWQKRANQAIGEREGAFRAAINAATAVVKELESALSSSEMFDPHRVQPQLDKLQIRMAEIGVMRKSVSTELGSQATLIESRVNGLRQAVADIGIKTALLERLTDAVLLLPENPLAAAQTDRYGTVLDEYVASLPADPRWQAMKSAAESNPLPAITARQKLIKRWLHFVPEDRAAVDARLSDIRGFFKQYPQSPDREIISQYQSWLESILRRFEEDGDPEEGAQRRFLILYGSKFINDANVLKDTDGNTYYLQNSPTYGSVTNITYYTGFNGEVANTSLAARHLLTPRQVPAPQQTVVTKVRTIIRNLTIDSWRDDLLDVSDSLLKAERIDDFLRYILVLKSLEFAARGDWFLQLELAKVIENLNDDDIDRSVPWMDPNNNSAKAARDKAKEILAAMPDLSPLFTAANKRQARLEPALYAQRFSVGWLEKTTYGKWICRTKWSPDGEYSLYVVTPPDEKGSRTWASIGNVKSGTFVVDTEVAQSVGEAAIVFAALPGDDAKTANGNRRSVRE